MAHSKMILAITLTAAALSACTYHRTVVERPIVEHQTTAPGTVIVPPGSDVTITPRE